MKFDVLYLLVAILVFGLGVTTLLILAHTNSFHSGISDARLNDAGIACALVFITLVVAQTIENRPD